MLSQMDASSEAHANLPINSVLPVFTVGKNIYMDDIKAHTKKASDLYI